MSTATQDNWTGEGYEAPTPGGSGGIHFRLKTKGQKARMRLVSAAYRYYQHFEKDGVTESKPRASWMAILKEIVNGKVEKRVVVFHGGPMIYGLIRDLNENESWGDPTLYDIEVERTEETGKYYTVTPMPKPMGPISDEDVDLVADSGINLIEACTKGKDTSDAGGTEPYDPYSEA